jgi:hypothetical protein
LVVDLDNHHGNPVIRRLVPLLIAQRAIASKSSPVFFL